MSAWPLSRRLIFAGAAAACAALLVWGGAALWSMVQAPPQPFQPQVGQPGKDVIWVPTPDALVRGMLTMADVGPEDRVVDLGSGDGKIPIAAARDFGATARGVEFNPDMVALSRRLAAAAGVADRATFIEGDIFETDISDATVVTLYLLPAVNLRLRPRLLALAPGTRIVSHDYDMGEWAPDGFIEQESSRAFLWIVPANAAGRWAIPLTTGEEIGLRLEQKFQALSGVAEIAGRESPVTEARLNGALISLKVSDWRGGEWTVTGTIEGDVFRGGVTRGGGDIERFFEVRRDGAK